ncbi:MAG: SurA N-terminal domain-containing protein [Rhodocyclaceae bacterium]|nr:SurA N-terminal domain-containing protein [Rhodocyclaceae bacterium]
MFDAIRSNRRIVQAILGLIVVTFAFFGVESYLSSIGKDSSLATVGDTKIGPVEFENALRRQQDQIRAQFGADIDVAQLNSPEIRRAVLDGLVNQRLLALYAADSRLAVSADQLRQVIGSIDEFKQDGQFSRSRYEQVLRAQHLSEAQFEAKLRRDVAFQQLTTAVGSSAIAARKTARQLLALQLEERTVATSRVSAEELAGEIAVSDDEVQAFYRANQGRFRLPARVKADYLVLDREKFIEKIEVDEAQVEAWYQEHQDRYRREEERSARHILIELPADAGEDEVAEATARAERILAEVQATGGENFAAVAARESEDPGSAGNGGDLGYFTRDAMVAPFADAVFALKEGAISDVVRSDFGLHVIQLTGIRPEQVRPLDEVRETIRTELRQERAAREFAHAAEAFANTVYEQPDSLAPAAEQFGLTVASSDWISRGGGTESPFDNPRLVGALFSSDSLERKLNTEAVDVGNGRLVSARVAAYEPEKTEAVDEVREEIVAELKLQAASEAAAKRGQELVTRLRAGETVELEFGEPTKITRGSGELDPQVQRELFAMPASVALPAYGGALAGDKDFVVFRLEAVNTPPIADNDPRLAAVRSQYERMLAERDLQAFLAELRRKYKVEVNLAALQSVAS